MTTTGKVQTIVFWQNMLSMHLAPFIRSIAADKEINVFVAYTDVLPDDRLSQGWSIPNFGHATLIDARDAKALKQLCALNDRSVCHSFGNFLKIPQMRHAFAQLKGKECKRIWITEAFDFNGLKGSLRVAWLRLSLWRVKQDIHTVFAMGSLGVDFYKRVGLAPQMIYEFAYLTDPSSTQDFRPNKSSTTRLIFVGQLIRRKGIDILLRACAKLKHLKWTLDIVGIGEDGEALMKLAQKLDISDRVRFVGSLPNEAVRDALSHSNCLVLPSRWDGWGAVVNEALLAGCPVILSRNCGAASLIKSKEQGIIVPAKNVSQLAGAICEVIDGRLNKTLSLKCWALEKLSPEHWSEYFLEVINRNSPHDKGHTPWC